MRWIIWEIPFESSTFWCWLVYGWLDDWSGVWFDAIQGLWCLILVKNCIKFNIVHSPEPRRWRRTWMIIFHYIKTKSFNASEVGKFFYFFNLAELTDWHDCGLKYILFVFLWMTIIHKLLLGGFTFSRFWI